MAFLTGKIDLKVYTDSAQTEFPQELFPSLSKEFTSSTVTEAQTVVISLAALASQAINLNSVATVKRFYIYSSATDISVNINGLGNITCSFGEPGLVPFTVSSMTITNDSATTATTVTVVLIAST